VVENEPCAGFSCRQVKSATRVSTWNAGAGSSEKKPLRAAGATQPGSDQSSPATLTGPPVESASGAAAAAATADAAARLVAPTNRPVRRRMPIVRSRRTAAS
jgi:hypothetical protein